MNTRDIVWLAAAIAFAAVIGALAGGGIVAPGMHRFGTVEWLILGGSGLIALAALRCFIVRSFDRDGKWRGRILRRR